MRQRDKKEIFRLIEREAEKGSRLSVIVEKIHEDFDISIGKAVEAVTLWVSQGGRLVARRTR